MDLKKFGVIVLIIAIIVAIVALVMWKTKRKIETSYNQAVEFYENGDVNEALVLFEELKNKTRFNPYHLDSMYRYALIKSDLGDQSAREIWEQILLEPISMEQRAQALFSVGKLDFDAKKFDSAKEKFNQVITDFSDRIVPYAKSMFFMGEIERLKGLHSYLDARQWYKKVIELNTDDKITQMAKEKLGDMNIALFFSPIETPESIIYTVHPGDSLALIAQKSKTTIQLLKESNRLKNNFIRPNDRIKIPAVDFSLLVSKTKNTLTILNGGEFFKEYLVGTGKFNKTPEGTFKITNKLKEPVWYKPEGGVIPFGSPDNLLGTRWMGISFPGYGIHGTWDEDSVGKQSSAGCIRLRNKSVEELYKIIVIGTKVVITE